MEGAGVDGGKADAGHAVVRSADQLPDLARSDSQGQDRGEGPTPDDDRSLLDDRRAGDHAGVGDYYGPFDAQTIFDDITREDLQIEIFRGDHTVWCNECNEVVMMRDCPHGPDDYLFLSGTKVREMLAAGESLPGEFARPEVAAILMEYYQSEAS